MPPWRAGEFFPDIHYLRWARSQATRARIPLTQSGMAPPDSGFLPRIPTAQLLQGDPSDHPLLAAVVADSIGVERERVLVQPGTHWTLMALVAARLSEQPGPVVVEEPAYEPLYRIPAALGAQVLRLPRPRAGRFALDLEALDALAAARPSLLLLTFPHNPSGALLAPAELERLCDWSERTGCAVLSDEVYLEFLEEPERWSLHGRIPGAMSVRSFTKVMGFGPLRVTLAVGPRSWIARAGAVTDYGPVMLPCASHALALQVWEHRDALWSRARRRAAEGWATVQGWAAGMEGLVEVIPPRAGIVCFPQLSESAHASAVEGARRAGVAGPFGFGLDEQPAGSHEWITALHQQRGVLLTPGTFFEDPRAFRLGFGGAVPQLREGLAALAQHLREAVAAS
jgi:aspartate/methionine/tyrosine aminotransferase